MPTGQQKLKTINDTIKERSTYLRELEVQIEDFTTLANNRLFELHGQIDEAEVELAKVMKNKLLIEQFIRENKYLLE